MIERSCGGGSLRAMTQPPNLATTQLANPQADIFHRLLQDRIVVLGTDVNDEIANYITAQLLYLGGPRQRKAHLALHQLSWRFSYRWNGHLRHYAVR